MSETATATPSANGVDAKPKIEVPKIKSITVDTFTAFQKNQVLDKWDNGKATNDDWKDYGTEIVLFVRRLQERGFTIAAILGYEGSGKSYGMKGLPAKTNIWYNADNKNSTYKGGKDEYGTINSPKYTMRLPKTYEDVLTHIDLVKSKGMLDENPVAFLIGHLEEYKGANGVTRNRLKTLGKLTNKINIEDMFTMCYYTEAVKEGEKMKFYLRTQNSGFDTCRSLEDQHPTLLIPNNFQTIIEAIEAY